MPSGILIVDKPPDWTSMDVCAKLRGVLGERRVGHGGTLDPMATGVLPVFAGRATRAASLAENGEKEYLASLRLGLVTNTQDITGQVLQSAPVHVAREDVEAVLARFRGRQEQLPPMYSAVKVRGKKLYELARRGVEVERRPREITVFALELLPERDGQGDLQLRVRCSKGTYIRTLCHDIGAALGCGGCMAALRRTEAAGFSLADAVSLDEVIGCGDPASLLRPVDTLFQTHPALTVNARGEERLRHGAALRLRGVEDGLYRVYAPGGGFLLLGRVQGGALSGVKNFFEG